MGIDVVIRLIDADNEDEKVKVVKMVNQCYRSHRGWTTEVGLVQGDRLTMQNLEDQIRRYSFFLADHDSFGVIGCIKTGIVNSTVIGPLSQPAGYAGVLAVLPEFQGKRIGSRLLSFAESFCRGKGAQRMVMDVLNHRHKLLCWYERCGYQATGETLDATEAMNSIGNTLLKPTSFIVISKPLI